MTTLEKIATLSDKQCREKLIEIVKSYENYPNYLSNTPGYAAGYRAAWFMAFDDINETILED